MFEERFAPHAYALMRVVMGALFALHGSQKLFGFPPMDQAMTLPAFVRTGAWIELIGGGLMVIGFFTSIAAFVCSGEMAVAYFMYHAPGGFLPLKNKGELAVVFCFVFFYIAMRGPGVWTIDSLIRNRR